MRDPIQQSVLDRIRAGSIRRRPRAYFVLRVAAVLALAALLFVVSALVVSLALFSMRVGGQQFLLGFGASGVRVFLVLFPWRLALLAVLLVVGLLRLMQSFRFGYRLPVLGLIAVLLLVSVSAGVAVSATPLHGTLFHEERRHGLPPPFGGVYEHVLDRHDTEGVFRGVVTQVSTTSVTMVHDDIDKDHDDGAYQVHMPQGFDPTSVTVGERLLIFGQPELTCGAVASTSVCIQATHYQELSPL